MARLDYLKTLGVDALWLTPVYVSPRWTTATTSPITST
jgi:glycosidase